MATCEINEMTIAKLNWYKSNSDKIELVIKGDIPRIIILKDRYSALELNRQLTIAYFEDHEGELSIDIDGNSYTFPLNVWQAILSVTDQWLEDYIPREETWLS